MKHIGLFRLNCPNTAVMWLPYIVCPHFLSSLPNYLQKLQNMETKEATDVWKEFHRVKPHEVILGDEDKTGENDLDHW